MALLLMVLAVSLLGVAVSAVVFAAATRDTAPASAPAAHAAPPLGVQNFFAEGATSIGPAIPIELLRQIQRHVRLERAAAEAFHAAPTRDALHRRTRSPLVGLRNAS